jgi:hypothetical protein
VSSWNEQSTSVAKNGKRENKIGVFDCDLCDKKDMRGLSSYYLHLSRSHEGDHRWKDAYRRVGGTIRDENPVVWKGAPKPKKKKLGRPKGSKNKPKEQRQHPVVPSVDEPFEVHIKYCPYCGGHLPNAILGSPGEG